MAIFKINLDIRKELLIQIGKIKKLKKCAKHFELDSKTIYVELVEKSTLKPSGFVCNKCVNRFKCTHFSLEISTNKKDDLIKLKQCPLLKETICYKLKHFPYVCNECAEKNKCKKLKRYYDPIKAQTKCDELKSESRKVIKLTKEQIAKINPIVTKRIMNGQSIHHIHVTCKLINSLISEKTLERYLYAGRFEAKAYMLPMYTTFDHVRHATKDKLVRENKHHRDDGRSFADFVVYCETNNVKFDYWEYDSIEGKKKDTKMIMTITYVEFDFQFGIIYEKYNYNDALEKLRELQRKLGEKF